jgi:DNA-binding NtrC family response regulator
MALEAIVERRGQTTEAQQLDELAGRVLALPDAPGHKLERLERAMIARAIDASGGNRSEAARLLGMDRRTLERRWQIGGEPADGEEPDDDS